MLWSKQQFWLFSPLFGQQGKHFYPNAEETFKVQIQRYFLCWHMLDGLQWLMCPFMCCWSESGILTRLFAAYRSRHLCGLSGFNLSNFLYYGFFFSLKSVTQRRCKRKTITRLLYQSSNILCLVFTTGNAGWEWVKIFSTVERLYRCWSHPKLFCHHFA